MKQFLILISFCLFSFPVLSQQTKDTISSIKLNEDRELLISLPVSYDKNPNKKYPLLVVLDGDYLFAPFKSAINYGAYWDDLPEMIIVGITQNKKNERVSDCNVDAETNLPSEKGALFFEFIGQELLPFIQNRYRTTSFKIIAGHDITAGYLNFFLYKDQPLFDGYISLNAELPAGMEEQIPQRLTALKQPIFYYHSSANGDTKEARARIQQLDNALKTINKPTLNYGYDYFKGVSHYSSALYSIPPVLHQFFSMYQPISVLEYQEKIAVLPEGYTSYLSKKYETIENIFGIKKTIRINDFKAIEAAILQNKAYNELDELSILADKNYPKTMLPDYELALMFEKKGDNQRAVRYYMSAYQKTAIGDLTKEMMVNRADELRKTLPKKGEKEPEPLEEEKKQE